MTTFYAIWGDQVIGSTRLEHGDPPMGVAFGVFVPNDRYLAFCQSTPLLDTGVRPVEIRTEDGTIIPSEGAYVRDFPDELGDAGREVEMLGIPYPLYGVLFPDHVRSYEEQFK
jgi:hypothetical protein